MIQRTAPEWEAILRACGVDAATASLRAPVFAHVIKPGVFSAGEDDLRAFLPTILVESQHLTRLRENGRYSAKRIRELGNQSMPGSRWRSLVPRADELANNADKFFEACYGGRGGNRPEGSGDGRRYFGRGFIMLTFADGYRWQGLRSGQDLTTLPELVEQPYFALGFAVDWWEGKIPDAYLADTARVRKIVNGGTFGLEEIRSLKIRTDKALAASLDL